MAIPKETVENETAPNLYPFSHQPQEHVCEETIISVIHNNYPGNKPYYSC